MIHRSSVMVLLVCAAAGVHAQEPQRPGGPGGPGDPPPGFAIFAALDADHNNALSAAEIDNAGAVLKQLDRNGDGTLTPDEFPAGRGGPGGRGPSGRGGGSGVGDEAPAAPTTPDELATMLMAFDRNKDGKLTKAEVPERLQGVFARADENKDGVLSADEIKKAAAAQPQPAAGGRGGREGEGREGRAGEPGGRGGPPRRDALLSVLDQDGDGALSAEEIAAAPAALKKLDANGDGILSLEEVFAGGRGRG